LGTATITVFDKITALPKHSLASLTWDQSSEMAQHSHLRTT